MLAILVQSTYQVWTVIGFKLNQSYIEQNLCQNRFDKIPVCKGSCVLEKQLNDLEQKQDHLPSIKLKEITLFHADIFQYPTNNTWELETSERIYGIETSSIATSSIPALYRPPNNIV
jgi:hypothetical protein